MSKENKLTKDHRGAYNSWESARKRCASNKGNSYKNYKARGIKVCDRWKGIGGFERFLEDMGDRPEGFTIERIDNDKGYSPENCRWATKKEQMRNLRKTIFIEIDGKEVKLIDYCEELGIDYQITRRRLKYLDVDPLYVFQKTDELEEKRIKREAKEKSARERREKVAAIRKEKKKQKEIERAEILKKYEESKMWRKTVGQVFGDFRVITRVGRDSSGTVLEIECIHCGDIRTGNMKSLKRGSLKNCKACSRKWNNGRLSDRYPFAYAAWVRYKHLLCEEWKFDSLKFCEYLGEKPDDCSGVEFDIDCEISPDNLKWKKKVEKKIVEKVVKEKKFTKREIWDIVECAKDRFPDESIEDIRNSIPHQCWDDFDEFMKFKMKIGKD